MIIKYATKFILSFLNWRFVDFFQIESRANGIKNRGKREHDRLKYK